MPFTATPPLTLYIHVPWCVRKCPYCDFNSHALRDELPADAYVDALLSDLEQDLPLVWGRTVESIFIGGGTPSLLPGEAINRLLEGVRARLNLKPGAEITMEANPGTAEQGRFDAYREAGVNRLSIGVQSFDDIMLGRLGRIHDAREARQAVKTARAAGFDRLNLDLMFALPEQDVAGALADLHSAIELEPSHLSWYQLTLEPNTLFYREPPRLPDDDLAWDIQQAGTGTLHNAGYTQYEVSAWAQGDERCHHNLNYWRFGDYLGIGAGAHAKVTDAATDRVVRTSKRRHPRDYMEKADGVERISEQRTLDHQDLLAEYMLNRLRLAEPFTLAELETATGLSAASAQPLLAQALELDWLTLADKRLTTTDTGKRFLNDLMTLFLPEPDDTD